LDGKNRLFDLNIIFSELILQFEALFHFQLVVLFFCLLLAYSQVLYLNKCHNHDSVGLIMKVSNGMCIYWIFWYHK